MKSATEFWIVSGSNLAETTGAHQIRDFMQKHDPTFPRESKTGLKRDIRDAVASLDPSTITGKIVKVCYIPQGGSHREYVNMH